MVCDYYYIGVREVLVRLLVAGNRTIVSVCSRDLCHLGRKENKVRRMHDRATGQQIAGQEYTEATVLDV
jgi:hypothetical protein